MDHQAAHIADVCHVAVQVERLGEPLAGFATALQHERDHRSVAASAEVLLGALVPRARGKTRVVDALDGRLTLQELHDLGGVRPVAVHAQRERLDALEDRPCVERTDRHAQVAQHLHPRLDDERTGAERGPVRQTVVARIGLGEVREASARGEVELAAVDDATGDRGAMTTEELGHRVHDDVGTPLERTDAVGGGDGVVDHERHTDIVGDLGDSLDVEHVVARVGQHLAEEGLGVRP